MRPSVWPWDLLIVIAKATRTGNWRLDHLYGKSDSSDVGGGCCCTACGSRLHTPRRRRLALSQLRRAAPFAAHKNLDDLPNASRTTRFR